MVGTMTAIGLGLTALGGLISGHFNAKARKAEVEAQKTEIDNALHRLDRNNKNQLDSLQQNYDHAIQSIDNSTVQNKSAMLATGNQRQMDASASAMLNLKQTDMQFKELAQLLASNEQAEGSAVSSVATSGFKMTGSGQNLLDDVKRQTSYRAQAALDNIKLTTAQNFQQAASNYFSQSVRLDNYQQALQTLKLQKAQTEEQYTLQKNQLSTEYEEEKKYLQEQKDNLSFGAGDIFEILTSDVALPLLNQGVGYAGNIAIASYNPKK